MNFTATRLCAVAVLTSLSGCGTEINIGRSGEMSAAASLSLALNLSTTTDGKLTNPFEIIVTVKDEVSQVAAWSLTADPSTDETPIELASGAQILNGEIRIQIHPDILESGDYIVTFATTDAAGITASEKLELSISWALDAVILNFIDLEFSVADTTFRFERSYNNADRNTDGELGYGWQGKLSGTTVDAEVSSGAFSDGTRVVITLPDGTTHGFTFAPIPGTVLFGTPLNYLPRFVPDVGVTSQLLVDSVYLDKVGSEYVAESDGTEYNPANPVFGNLYELTTGDGRTFVLNAETGELAKIENALGEWAEFHGSQIDLNGSHSILFSYNSAGRLQSIDSSLGSEVTYTYDANGDLVKVEDEDDRVTEIDYYGEEYSHYLRQVR